MRQRFEQQLALGQVPIDQVHIPTTSRDELPPVLRGLQWIFQTPEVNEQIFALLETKVIGTKQATGRPGMDLWQILVLGVVRLALDCDYDRLSYLVHYDKLLRQLLGLESAFTCREPLGRTTGDFGKQFHHKTLSDNVRHVDAALLQEINAIVVQAGRPLLKKNAAEPLRVKSDTYVLETNVHFPTDLNLLWDACRKCILLVQPLSEEVEHPGWRKYKTWLKQVKARFRRCGQIQHGGGVNTQERFEQAVRHYLQRASDLEQKVEASLHALQGMALTDGQRCTLDKVEYFHEMLVTHLDLIERRVLRGETIPHDEKLFSLCEPHTEWIQKGKLRPAVELGHKLLVTTDQYGLVLDYKVMDHTSDVSETIPLVDRLLARYGDDQIQSFSVDKGLSAQQDRELLELYIPEVIMPKKGRRTHAEQARETHKAFRHLRRKHSAIESDIHCLEAHGLNRCPDKGLHGFTRYVGFGMLAYNLHKIGNQLIARPVQLKRAA